MATRRRLDFEWNLRQLMVSAYDLMCRGGYGLTCRGWRADHATVRSPPSIAVRRCFSR